MKTFIIVLFALFAVQTISAQTPEFTVEKKSAIVDNLANAIVSENRGLHTSGALVLSDLINASYLEKSDASKAMIPLMKLLKEGETEEERIAAGVALRDVAVFDDNER